MTVYDDDATAIANAQAVYDAAAIQAQAASDALTQAAAALSAAQAQLLTDIAAGAQAVPITTGPTPVIPTINPVVTPPDNPVPAV